MPRRLRVERGVARCRAKRRRILRTRPSTACGTASGTASLLPTLLSALALLLLQVEHLHLDFAKIQ